MNAKEANQIVSTHPRGGCNGCNEGECMDEALLFLEVIKLIDPIVRRLEIKIDCCLNHECYIHNTHPQCINFIKKQFDLFLKKYRHKVLGEQ